MGFFPIEFSCMISNTWIAISIICDTDYLYSQHPTKLFSLVKNLYLKVVTLHSLLYNCLIFSVHLTIIIIRKGDCVVEVVRGTEWKANDFSIFLIYLRWRNKRTEMKQNKTKIFSIENLTLPWALKELTPYTSGTIVLLLSLSLIFFWKHKNVCLAPGENGFLELAANTAVGSNIFLHLF